MEKRHYSTDSLRRHHDMGGSDHGPFEIDEHEASDLDKRVDALVNLLADPAIQAVLPDERRRGIEELSEEAYESLTYYQRWLAGVVNVLTQKKTIDSAHLVERLAQAKRSDRGDEEDACST